MVGRTPCARTFETAKAVSSPRRAYLPRNNSYLLLPNS